MVSDDRVHLALLYTEYLRRYYGEAAFCSSSQRFGDDAKVQGLAKIVAIR